MDIALSYYYKAKAMEINASFEPADPKSIAYKNYHKEACKDFNELVKMERQSRIDPRAS